jgi:hypothetical protein
MGEQYPSVNGRASSWANMKVVLAPTGATPFATRAFSAIKFAHKADGEHVMGTGSIPIAKTDGTVKPEGSMTMYLREAIQFRRSLASINAEIATVDFDVHVSWSPKSGPAAGLTFDAVLRNCSINAESFDAALGSSAQEVEIELLYTLLEVDGITLYRS